MSKQEIILMVISLTAFFIVVARLVRWKFHRPKAKAAPEAETTQRKDDFLLNTEDGRKILEELELSEADIKRSQTNQAAHKESIAEAELEERVYKARAKAVQAWRDTEKAKIDADRTKIESIKAAAELRKTRARHPGKIKKFWRKSKRNVKAIFIAVWNAPGKAARSFCRALRRSKFVLTGTATAIIIVIIFKFI